MNHSLNSARSSIIRPSFMTMPMWFAWLLRTDVRAGKLVDDPVAQRDFVIWWLLWGGAEYPAIWWYGPRQIAVAMEALWVVDEVPLPRIICSLWQKSKDLRDQFPLENGEDAVALLCWYRLYARREYNVAPDLPANYVPFIARPSRALTWSGGPPVPAIAVAFWSGNTEVSRIFDASSRVARKNFADWFATTGHKLLPSATSSPDWIAPESALERRGSSASTKLRRRGVNLVGYARAEFGIGEDVRVISRALASIGLDHVILDVGAPPGVQAGDRSQEGFLSHHLVYSATIFCMTVFDMCELLLKRGPELFLSTFNIGFCPWELPVFPKIWADAEPLIDEIWAATKFQECAYRSTFQLPVIYIPAAIDPPPVRSRVPQRPQFKFVYPFDPKSYLSRKNPVAAVKAFRRAFPLTNHSVQLILRVNGAADGIPGWQKVVAAMRGDPRIRVKAGTLERRDALASLTRCDCLVSPHRAEGFGRNIVEAIALGIPVIATGFSGSGDYLRKEERLRSRQKRLAPGEYPFGEGQWWSEPDIVDLAIKMRVQIGRRASTFALKQRAKRLLAVHGPKVTGRRIQARLAVIDSSANL